VEFKLKMIKISGAKVTQCHLVKNDMNANYTKIKPGVHLIGFIFCNYTYLD
jgi:hypothetical protein